MSTTIIPTAVFLPPVAEQLPDPLGWLPNDKHRVLEFLRPDSPRVLMLAQAVTIQ